MHQINKNPTIEDLFLYYYLARMKPYQKGKTVQRYDFEVMKCYGVNELLNFASASLKQNFTQANTSAVFAELGKLQFDDLVKYSTELSNIFWVLKFDHFKDLLSPSPKNNYKVLQCADLFVDTGTKTLTAQDVLDYTSINSFPFQANLAQETSDFFTKFYLVP